MADNETSSSERYPEELERLFENLFVTRFDRIRYFFVSHGCSDPDSRDLTQEVFIAAYKGLGSFRFAADPSTWLLKIARHNLLNFLRSRRAIKRSMVEVADTDEHPLGELPDAAGVSPESRLSSEQAVGRVEAAIDALPPQMRQCLRLRIRGLEYHEIAALMNLSIETVKSHLYQARSRLRPRLEGGDGGVS